MVKVYLYNAGKGDCLRIQFGCHEPFHNIFIDSGVMRFGSQFKDICEDIVKSGESLDLLIITHMDEDHLGGALWLSRTRKFPFKKVLINGSMLASDESSDAKYRDQHNIPLSKSQNNELIKLLSANEVIVNNAIQGDIIELADASIRIMWPTEELANQIYKEQLTTPFATYSDYGKSMEELFKTPFHRRDSSLSNRASIVFIFECEDKKMLFTGDAWGDDVVSVVKEQKNFDLIKLPHHGSSSNISEAWSSIHSNRFVVSADGKGHPDKQTIAKILGWNPNAIFYGYTDWWSKGFLLTEERNLISGFVLANGSDGYTIDVIGKK